ncbi:dihydrolipoamide acetyltransferase family protein [Methylocystis parvus]|uniref:Dihydrolipoamide acetyltransferase component of pyruvate dehydrogenase complex n=1 Tax=Methylocystis parvus TaxID=134 RepID=A0A6B8M893_9HYPH|nr:dihydrolipoamide acetyltransferase family protein [Methylocystis parvus]QGM97849.1 2-oxo acid dehydrogenase subunit E2 [Methylocystis parvus]WBK01843.1 2-oxo acid dehydrogenase subunit E2 [Methylocystis parvus OBBP]
MKTFRLPDLGEGLQEAELVEWRVKPGDEVALDQPLLSVETAKAVVEIPSPRAGRIERLFGEAGEIVRVGAPLVAFEGERDEDAGTVVGMVETGASVMHDVATTARAGAQIRVIPAVRALARKLDVDLAIVTPSGPDGQITAQDVQRVAKLLSEIEPAEPLRGFRRAMAQNMSFAQAEVAAATLMDDVAIDCWEAGADITIRLIRALAKACEAEPILNSWYESATLSLRRLRKIDLGIAVDTPDGLFVPVLRDVGARSAADLREGLDRMRTDVAARRIPPEELRGATITLSNFGTIAGRYAAPVVLPPTVAILGAGKIRRQPIVRDECVKVGAVLPLSLTFDHRVVSGGEAGRFLAAVMTDLAQIV